MTIVNFSYVNIPPHGYKILEKPALKFLAQGLDTVMLVVGNFENSFECASMALLNLQVFSPYSIHLGFIYMMNDGEFVSADALVHRTLIPSYNQTTPMMDPYTFVYRAAGLREKSFGWIINHNVKDSLKQFGASGIFETRVLKDVIHWHGKVKPHSWRSSYLYNLERPLVFPPKVGFGTRAYLFIVIGDAPTELSEEPIYIAGQINWT